MPLLFVVFMSTQLIVRVGSFALAPRPSSRCGTPPSLQRRHSSTLQAANRRAGARARRKKDAGFGRRTEEDAGAAAPTEDVARSDSIYSMPSLYDLAFGYRSYDDEVAFLLDAHARHAPPSPAPAPDAGLRILELAAGPARHALAALAQHPPSAVDAAVALDRSSAMVDYGRENADAELGGPGGRRDDFAYVAGDMRRAGDATDAAFDTAWLLLGSLQHLLTNADVVACFASVAAVLRPGGTVILELPHPRETFKMGECTRNGWTVPLAEAAEDAEGGEREYGALEVVWGDDGDAFDPIRQVRHCTVGLTLTVSDAEALSAEAAASPMFQRLSAEGKYALTEIVPMRLYTWQEIDALARCAGLEVAATYGALAEVSVDDEEGAFRMVCVLTKA